MKKSLALVLALLIVGVFASCSASKQEENFTQQNDFETNDESVIVESESESKSESESESANASNSSSDDNNKNDTNQTTVGNPTAYEGTEGLAFYPLPDGTYGVKAGTTEYLTSIVIPATYNGKAVTRILPRAFTRAEEGYESESNLVSISIPDSVISIDEKAFYNCNNLISITIPKGVTSIGDGAFMNCSSLIEVINKSSLKITKDSDSNGYVANYALEVHSGESKIVNKDNYLFYSTESGNYLVKYSGTDKELTLPANYNGKNYQIYDRAFLGNKNITKVNIPNGVTSIGYNAFASCSYLTSVTIPNSVTSIGSGAFSGCFSLTSVTIPNSVTSIEDSVFYGCTSLTSVTIPNSVTSIGSSAFVGCFKLTSITIPKSVTRIDRAVFAWCESLTTINYRGTESQWNAISKHDSWDSDIMSSSVKIVYNYAG